MTWQDIESFLGIQKLIESHFAYRHDSKFCKKVCARNVTPLGESLKSMQDSNFQNLSLVDQISIITKCKKPITKIRELGCCDTAGRRRYRDHLEYCLDTIESGLDQMLSSKQLEKQRSDHG